LREISINVDTGKRFIIVFLNSRKECRNLREAVKKGRAFQFFRSIFPVKVPAAAAAVEIPSVADAAEPEPEPEPESCPSVKLRLLLSVDQMLEEGYPLRFPGVTSEKYGGYVLTKDSYEEAHDGSPLFSVDCEMCLTCDGMELTRICVVDSELKVRTENRRESVKLAGKCCSLPRISSSSAYVNHRKLSLLALRLALISLSLLFQNIAKEYLHVRLKIIRLDGLHFAVALSFGDFPPFLPNI
jgi:hypothetical protein